MKKSLYISLVALVFSVAALVKVFVPCNKGATGAVTPEEIQQILTDNPVIVVTAMQSYEQKLREQMETEANAMIQSRINDLNNFDGDIFEGKKGADIVLVQFFDYACGYCHRLFPAIEEILANNNDIKVVYKPLAFVSQYSDYAARAVMAANKQGKFKALHTALFTAEEPLSEEMINRLAKKVGLDMDRFTKDVASEEVAQVMSFNNELAGAIQIGGVPTMILNGQLLQTLDAGVIQDRINNLR